MKRLLPILFLLITACKSDKITIPEGIMAQDKMKAILIDIHVTDAIAETKAQAGMDEKMLTEEYHQQVFKNHHITYEEFMHSFRFYEANPKLLDEVYNDILNELTKREAQAAKN